MIDIPAIKSNDKDEINLMNEWPADILIYAAIAGVLVLWLRNVLGTRHGDERQRPNPFTQNPDKPSPKPANDLDADSLNPANNTTMRSSYQDYADQAAETGMLQIALIDKNFSPLDFIEKAEEAFTLIITAFARGDRDLLRDLLHDNVYRAFDNAIREREKQGQTVDTEVHAIRKTRIIDAMLVKNRHATLTLRFTADETCVIRDRDGEIISGHPDHVTEMIDVWVFTRDLKSSDPRWFLSETRDDVVEDHDAKTPIPEA